MSLSIATPRGKRNRVLGRQCEEGRTPTPSRLSLLRRTKGRSLRAAKWTEHISQYKPKRSYNSKYQEFMAAEWRYSRTDINITHETLIPKLPAKPIQEPNDAAYHN
jgi:hypothetical protein